MSSKQGDPEEPTYSLGAVARLTGLSPHVLRAWERRYAAVTPLRTPGGTRRYREADVKRLRRLRDAVRAGHAIGEVANASDQDLDRRLEMAPSVAAPALAPILEAVEGLDASAAERLLGIQLAALGPRDFVRLVAAPLLREIGNRWEAGSLCVASEHLASAVLRNLLGATLRARGSSSSAPLILFTTLPGEQHDLGTLMAAVLAADAGGNPCYLGGDLPVAEILDAATSIAAGAVVVGICRVDGDDPLQSISALRRGLPGEIELWVGGSGAQAMPLPAGVAPLADFEEIQAKVSLLAERLPA